MFQESFDTTKLVDEFHGSLFADTRTAREVVSTVTHERQDVDDLLGLTDAILGFYLFLTNHLIVSALLRTVHIDIRADKLAVVFIGCEHIGLIAGLACLGGNGADDIIGLEAFSLKDRNMVGFQNLLDDRHTLADVFRCGFTLGFVGREGLMAEGFTAIESHADMCGLFFRQYLVKSVTEAHDG